MVSPHNLKDVSAREADDVVVNEDTFDGMMSMVVTTVERMSIVEVEVLCRLA